MLDYLINCLDTNEGAKEVISIIALQKNLNYDKSSFEMDEIIEVFKERQPDLIRIKNRYSEPNTKL
ncbi:hypothetical protein BAE_10715 [Bacillus aerophilus]|nr:hypothetical protein BAE_10715 [Bacillus aerophilus]